MYKRVNNSNCIRCAEISDIIFLGNIYFRLIIYILISVLIIFESCSSSKKIVEPKAEKLPVLFDYAPKVLSQIGSANITVALVNPTFGNESLKYKSSLFSTFSKSMANDFEELLTSKGMKIRGPFEQVGEMLYNDKQNSDFIIEIEIGFDFNNFKRSVTRHASRPSFAELLINASSPTTISYSYSGTGSFTSILTLTAKSSNFGEKLWKKNITLQPINLDYIGVERWADDNASFLNEVSQDNSVYNIFAKALMAQYGEIFTLLDKQIEVEEFKNIKEEAIKVDKK